jgi:hypothetical protein
MTSYLFDRSEFRAAPKKKTIHPEQSGLDLDLALTESITTIIISIIN